MMARVTADEVERARAVLEAWRSAEQAATPGPWWSDESDSTWRLHGVAARLPGWRACTVHGQPEPGCAQCGRLLIPEQVVNRQILKAPKHGTPYAEYWPDEADSAFIVTARTAVPALLAVAAGALERHVRRDRPVMVTEVCAAHSATWTHWRFGEADRRATIRACADCTVTEKYVCARCRHECPDDDEWPCAEVRAVAEVLLTA
jgi:hypothetical protein